MTHRAAGEEQPPRENRTRDGDWKIDLQAPGFRNDVLLLYFSMSVFCGSFFTHYLYFILLITDTYFYLYWFVLLEF